MSSFLAFHHVIVQATHHLTLSHCFVGKTPAQILGRWCVQKKVVFIPKSTKRTRMLENAGVFDFELDSTDMGQLDCLTTDESLVTFEQLYRKCVVRDTPLAASKQGIKTKITVQ